MNDITIFGMPLFNWDNIINLTTKFILNLIVIFIIARLIYFNIRKNRSYLFALFIFNIIIFFVCSFLNHSTLSIGFAFGIFALFSVLRYRTISIPIKEMTYLFIAISIAIINALSNKTISLFELILTNFAIVFITFFIEKVWMKNENMKIIIYEKIDLVKPENSKFLLDDLKQRTGLNIHRYEIGKIDFLRDTTEIRVYYYNSEHNHFINEDDDNCYE